MLSLEWLSHRDEFVSEMAILAEVIDHKGFSLKADSTFKNILMFLF